MRGRRFCATCTARRCLTVGSTSVSCLRTTPGDVPLHERGEVECGVLVPVQDEPARLADVGAYPQRQLGFHRAAGTTRLRGGEPAVRDLKVAAVPHGPVCELAADLTEPGISDSAGELLRFLTMPATFRSSTTTVPHSRARPVVSLWIWSRRSAVTWWWTLLRWASARRHRFDGRFYRCAGPGPDGGTPSATGAATFGGRCGSAGGSWPRGVRRRTPRGSSPPGPHRSPHPAGQACAPPVQPPP